MSSPFSYETSWNREHSFLNFLRNNFPKELCSISVKFFQILLSFLLSKGGYLAMTCLTNSPLNEISGLQFRESGLINDVERKEKVSSP